MERKLYIATIEKEEYEQRFIAAEKQLAKYARRASKTERVIFVLRQELENTMV